MPKQNKKHDKQANFGKKNAVMRAYRKMLKEKKGRRHANQENNDSENQQTFFQRAMAEYEKRKAYREEKKKEVETKRKEREESLRKYREKKRQDFKKLSQKTKWGQPIMKGRMEILLEKIERTVASDKIK